MRQNAALCGNGLNILYSNGEMLTSCVLSQYKCLIIVQCGNTITQLKQNKILTVPCENGTSCILQKKSIDPCQPSRFAKLFHIFKFSACQRITIISRCSVDLVWLFSVIYRRYRLLI